MADATDTGTDTLQYPSPLFNNFAPVPYPSPLFNNSPLFHTLAPVQYSLATVFRALARDFYNMSTTKPIYTEGVGWRYATNHNQHRRHHSHDYSAVGTYLITITVSEALKEQEKDMYTVFGHIQGNVRAKRGDRDYAHIVCSPLGDAIYSDELPKINKYYPMVEVWQFCLMPNHIHMILHVGSPMPPKKHLGHVIGAFMGGISRAWWRLQQEGRMPLCSRPATDGAGTGVQHTHYTAAATTAATSPATDVAGTGGPSASGARALGRDLRLPLFEQGYNDHILMRDGQLDNWKRYIEDNPHRRLLRQCFPDIMERRLCVTIAGIRYSAFGNFSLLKHPEKIQGQCHVKARYGDLTPEERLQYGYTYPCAQDMKTHIPYELTQHFRDNYARTMTPVRTASAVLVTPGISEGEKQMKNSAIDEHLPLIHLQKDPIIQRWKPEESRFYACVAGTLLILAPWPEDMNTEGAYATFHRLNDIAVAICTLDSKALADSTVSIKD